ncbi:hypothetical protein FJ979_31985, partial [Mesorhizobium sp. B1-1-6]
PPPPPPPPPKTPGPPFSGPGPPPMPPPPGPPLALVPSYMPPFPNIPPPPPPAPANLPSAETPAPPTPPCAVLCSKVTLLTVTRAPLATNRAPPSPAPPPPPPASPVLGLTPLPPLPPCALAFSMTRSLIATLPDWTNRPRCCLLPESVWLAPLMVTSRFTSGRLVLKMMFAVKVMVSPSWAPPLGLSAVWSCVSLPTLKFLAFAGSAVDSRPARSTMARARQEIRVGDPICLSRPAVRRDRLMTSTFLPTCLAPRTSPN